ncbi:shikimate kinase [Sedimentitalea sp. CY04]|uniref:Gluconokinase n=2 Tax=Parasedimentitalea denitrificans TaxID=2211118 RepID=A0ABX0WAJ6_9RHOB|nr:shikimate kinase [Sedimentitalea sp. CY04]
MGVCGVGKSSVALDLAEALSAQYLEADDFHPESNISSMRRGEPLTDEMRWPWLEGICQEIKARQQEHPDRQAVVACSALKRAYRDLIRSHLPDAQFILLTGPKQLIQQRMLQRKDHFMPLSLLESQLADLERPSPDEKHISIDINLSRKEITKAIVAQLLPATRACI